MASSALVVLIGLMAVGTRTEPEPRYDPATVVDFAVVVSEVRDVAGEAALNGIRLTVRTETDTTVDIYLGPSSFVKEFDIVFAKGDRLHLTGSKVKFAGGSIVLAREVSKSQTTLYLRDRQGNPYWHAGN